MSKDPQPGTEQGQRDGLITYYCVAHRTPTAGRSPITIYRGSWAYCVNGYAGQHDWSRIEPTSAAGLRGFGPTFVEPKGDLIPA